MENYIQANNSELWMIIDNGSLIPKKGTKDGKINPKMPQEFNADDFKMMEKNAKAKKLLSLALDPMNTLMSQSVNLPRKFGMPSE